MNIFVPELNWGRVGDRYFFFLALLSFLASPFKRFSTFFISSPAGKCSGKIPLPIRTLESIFSVSANLMRAVTRS